MAAIKVRLLGELQVEVNGIQVSPRGEILRSLAALLSLSAGRPVAAETLIERLWGDDLPANPRATLHSAMARLRRVLGEDGVVTHDDAYELVIDPRDVDAVAMTEFFAAADREPDPVQKYELLDQGLALWAEPFEGRFVDWLLQLERARLSERYLIALERWADLGLQLGLLDISCTRLSEAASQHPLRESLWSRYMLALIAGGRRADAIAQYQRVCANLREELGVGPGEELQSAYAVATAGAQYTDAPMALRQLPADLSRFVGRRETLSELDRLLLPADVGTGVNSVVVLHGEAGVGKTSLAVRWAHTTEKVSTHEHLFVDLSGYARSSPLAAEEALDEVLRALGVHGRSVPRSLNGRSALFRSLTASRRLVLILDDARSAEQVRPLLPGGSSIVLITSRSRLDGLSARDGVHQVPVRPLRPGEARELLKAMIGKPAGAPHLDRLAQLCCGLPLALAVASARINRDPHLAVAELVDLFTSTPRLDVLTIDDDPASDLRAVLDGSYRALAPDVARLFRTLGVVGHPVCADAAATAASLDRDSAVRALRRLTDLHLLSERVPGRFGQHALLASFASEKARAEEGAAGVAEIESRLLEWYLHTVRAASNAMGVEAGLQYVADPPPDCQPRTFTSFEDAISWYDSERRQLINAVVDGARQGHHRAAAQLALNLWDYLERVWDFTDSMRVQRVALSSAKQAGDVLLEALASNQLGISSGRSGDARAACDLLRRALELFDRIDHDEGKALVADNLGLALRLTGEYAESARCLEASLATARRNGDELRCARLLNNLALTQLASERLADAAESAAEAVKLHRSVDDWRGLTYACDTLGIIRLREDDYADAVERLQEAVQLATEYQLGAPSLHSRVDLGRAYAGLGDVHAARSVWSDALRLYNDLPPGDRSQQASLGEELRSLLESLDPAQPSP